MRCIRLGQSDARTGASRRQLWLIAALACCGLVYLAARSLGSYQLDVYEYQCYAAAFWHGAAGLRALPPGQCDLMMSVAGGVISPRPFHTLPAEYGALALLAFSPPSLAPAAWYPLLFACEMALAVLATALLCARYGPPLAGYAYLAYVVIGNAIVTGTRFDAVPAALTLAALVWARRRAGPAYAALALATLLKVYPLVLLVPFLVADLHAPGGWRRGARGLAAYLGALAAGVGLSLLASAEGALAPLAFLTRRGVEFESLPASALWLAHLAAGIPFAIGYEGNVTTVVSPLAGAASLAGACLTGTLMLAAAWLQWRGKLTLGRACVVALLALLAGSKVFSPQYLLWAAPLVAVEFGAEMPWFAAWAGVCLLTVLAFPVAYEGDLAGTGLPTWEAVVWLSAARNVALLALALGMLVRRPARRAALAAEATPTPTRSGPDAGRAPLPAPRAVDRAGPAPCPP
jgi:hypothetical protein